MGILGNGWRADLADVDIQANNRLQHSFVRVIPNQHCGSHLRDIVRAGGIEADWLTDHTPRRGAEIHRPGFSFHLDLPCSHSRILGAKDLPSHKFTSLFDLIRVCTQCPLFPGVLSDFCRAKSHCTFLVWANNIASQKARGYNKITSKYKTRRI